MRKQNILIALILTVLFSLRINAQTTELVYSLGNAGSPASSIHIASVATDGNNNIFICGSFNGAGVNFNPLVVGSDSLRTSVSSGASTDGFIAKYNSQGHLLKVIAFGASSNDVGTKVYVDGTGNVYLLANITGANVKFDNTGVTFPPTAGSGATALVKYNNNLVLQVSRVIGKVNPLAPTNPQTIVGGTGDIIKDVKVFGTDVYITGILTNSTVNFNPAGGAGGMVNLSPSGSGSDIFIAKYDASLINLWANNFGGAGDDGGNGIDLDASGNIYLTGYFRGQAADIDPVGTVAVSEAGGGIVGDVDDPATGDAFVAKYNSAKQCQWAFNIGAALFDQGKSIVVNKTNSNVYVGGVVSNDALEVYFDPTSTTTAKFAGVGANDFFVASYTSAGAYNWHLANGTAGEEDLTSMSFDAGGNIVFSGFASGGINFGNSKTIAGLGGKDGYFAVASGTTGVVTAAYNVGGSSDEQANGVTVSSTGKILLVGDLSGNGDYDPSGATSTITKVGTQNGFIARYVLCTPPSISAQPSNDTKCEGLSTSFSITATGASSYQWKKGGANITGATNATYSIATLATGDAGSYTVDVTNSCQTVTSSAATLVVNPKPLITSVLTGSVCSGVPQNYFITSTVPSSFSWTRALMGPITPATNTSTANPIIEALTSSSTLPVNAVYVITPTSITGSCPGNPFNYTVTVNPKPTINSVATGSICSGVPQNYSITSSVASSYSWTRAAIAGITNPAGSGISSIITEALVNNSVSPVVVRYVITPTSTTGSCLGTAFNYDITVNPSVVPNVSIATPLTSVCAGASITFTATSTNGGTAPTYQWNKGGNPISNATNATYVTTTAANNDSYTVTMTSNAPCASPTSDVSNAIVMTVTPKVTPSVLISVIPLGAICAGTSVTFTAAPTNGGTPAYQWKKGGANIIGETNSTYTTTTAANNDSYTVAMTSTVTCPSAATVTSTPIVTAVNSTVTPSVSVSINTLGTICSGTSVTFTAAPTNGGTPTYQWKKGGANIVGETNSTYTTTGVANNDSYTVAMTSTVTCPSIATVTSAPIVMSVSSSVVPAVSASSSSTSICPGTSITLTASPTNGGTTPVYQWKKGGTNIVGATNLTFTTTAAVNNDSYTVALTNSSSCASPSTVTSNPVVITVNPVLIPSVSITADNSTICTGTNVKFTAAPINAGTSPTYQWRKAGSIIPNATNSTFSTTTAANNDSYTVEMVSNAICASTAPVNSNSIVITITASPTPLVAVTANTPNSICAGTNVTFTANPSNGGTPTYQWKKGAAIISGATSLTYTTNAIASGDTYSVDMVSSLTCVTTPNASSNVITMTVNPVIPSSVSISSSNTTICDGSSITLTATPSSGSTPAYKWKLGSAYIAGATNATYTTTGAINGNSYSVEMNNTAVCATPATVTSTPIVTTVNPNLNASVAVSVNNIAICAGAPVEFTATPTGGGIPTYQWKKGGSIISGATSSTYSTTTAANNDSYTVEMTSNAICATPVPAVSTPIVITVTPVTVPTISLTANSTTICSGESITLTASQTGGGTPSYKWKLGSSYITGATNSTYTTTTALNGDSYSVEMSSTASCATPGTVTSSGGIITVKPTLIPAVSITSSAATICAGSSITFTAVPTNGGTAPAYQWKKAGVNISGETSSTYITTSAVDAESYTVELTSNALCASPAKVISNAVSVEVDPILIPSVSITANNSTICAGTPVTFTATPVNGGTPTYKWKVGSSYISTATNASYTTTGALNGQSYTVEMVSDAACASTTTAVTSNAVVITITTAPSAAVSITSNPGNTICAGKLLTFTAVPGNGGTSPAYQWKLNGTPVSGATNVTYASSSFVDGDKVSVDMVSNSTCVTSPNAFSTATTITVNPVVTPSVTIAASKLTICAGESVAFTATPINGGTPVYQWKNGSTNISGATGAVFTSTTITNGNSISVEMTSTEVCGVPTTVPSNAIAMVVNPKVIPTVSVSASATTVCSGTSITLTSNQTGGGTPAYQWKKGGADISGATAATYVTATATNNDSYSVEMTSTEMCATPAAITSLPTVITVNTPTAITLQPTNQSVCALGNTVKFSVAAEGTNLTYQWIQETIDLANNATFAGVKTKELTISNVTNVQFKNYSVRITGTCGVVTSQSASLDQSTTPISISTQPAPQNVPTGGTISLSVIASGPSLSYQWKRNGAAISNDSRISGANSLNLIITNAQVSDNFNDYVCVISSPCATSVNSSSVKVTVSSTTAVHIAQAQGFKVAPNPSAGTFALRNDFAPFNVEQIEIVSLEGVVVLTKAVSGGAQIDEMIEATELASGMYLMIIKGEGQQALVKIAIDR